MRKKRDSKNPVRPMVALFLDERSKSMLADIQRHLECKTKSTALVWSIVQAHRILEFIDRAVAEAVPQIVRDGLRSGREDG